ncbi:FtsX-like permease family protein [Nostocoides sp. Soil756]|jgi:putative ABC transport system permease protein|uniref:FtsX-like permease family protein n=1 Tax=Nostocoides sp. Soil756 TaxID=1736399 RepID=UPI0006FBC37D|nr:FtsX-like permease family protein [Tetrasphaera sp. Soil756]KRE60393.1 hypothetical protein ASG78_14450 [Tetrasphaera sp. Soil756]
MSTQAPPRPEVDAGRHGTGPTAGEPGRLDRWRASWAVALRMARRDVRRHRGRSALVVVMVLLPTLLLSTVVTIAYTSDVTGAEKIPAAMGSGQALLQLPDTMRVAQGADPDAGFSGGSTDARTIPGYYRDASTTANAEAISRLVGAPVAALGRFTARTTVDDRRVSVSGLALDGRLGLGPKLQLLSGRWPATPSADPATPAEVLVTAAGTRRGLPSSGTVVVSVDGTQRTVRVVGTAASADGWNTPGLVSAAPLAPTVVPDGGWIVLGSDPVTWPEVQRLNEYGLRVTSAAVLRDPPPLAQLPAEVRADAGAESQRTGMMVGLAAAMLLIATTLLVGPAFAVSATRQRRTLALAASNGADTAALRRTVLAQALVLGTLSALLGVVLGVGVARLLVLWDSTTDYPSLSGPFDERVPVLLAVAACATLSTLVAALVPARRLGRLDIVGVMRGQSVSPRPSVLVLAVGALLTAVGAVLTLGGTGVVDTTAVSMLAGDSGETMVVVGAVVLILGSILLVPMVLAGLGRVGGRLPTSLRMAARDLARHRARSAPSVAAVLAVVAGLTFGLTGLASDTEQNRREYTPTTLPGEVLVVSGYGDDGLTDEAVQQAAPGLTVIPDPVAAGDPGRYSATPPQQAYRAPFVSLVPQGCSVEQTLSSGATPVERCMVAGTESFGSGDVLVLPADELVRRLGLDAADAAKVRAGAAVVMGTTDASARLVRGTRAADPQATEPVDPAVEIVSDRQVPLVGLPRDRTEAAALLGASMALPAGTATTAGWPTLTHLWTVRDPSGAPVSDAAVEQLQQRLGDQVGVHREDGFQRGDRVVVAILLAVFGLLILVVTLTSTALTLAEQQSDQATLAALGATRGTRRVMAAAQAFVLSVVGCVLGVAVGLVPGIAIARPLTSSSYDPLTGAMTGGGSILVIPWPSLLVVGLLVPVVAAGLAAAGIRRAPQVTRRAT